VEDQKSNNQNQLPTPDSIKYIVDSPHGSQITWRDEFNTPHTEGVSNLTSFTKKVKAVEQWYTLEADNTGGAFVYIYLNDSLVATGTSDDFNTTAFAQWEYK